MDLQEELAALCHDQWSGWMSYLFSKGTFNSDGTFTLPQWAVERWVRQAHTPYAELSGTEKDSDRTEAAKFMVIFAAQQNVGAVDQMPL
jgi:hypothetical protein